MSTITVNLGIQVSGGPPIAIPPHKIEGVESFQQIELSLKRGDKNNNDVVQSANLAKNPVFLAISSDWIDRKDEEKQGWYLSYKIGDGEAILLNAPQVYLRESILILAKDWNTTTKEITVTFQKGAGSPAAADTKEIVVKVNISIGYDLADSIQVPLP